MGRLGLEVKGGGWGGGLGLGLGGGGSVESLTGICIESKSQTITHFRYMRMTNVNVYGQWYVA